MIDRIKSINALIGLSDGCNATALLCNGLAYKQLEICNAAEKRMAVIEKKHKCSYFSRKDWKKLWRECCIAVDRGSYYVDCSKRAIADCSEYLARARKGCGEHKNNR